MAILHPHSIISISIKSYVQTKSLMIFYKALNMIQILLNYGTNQQLARFPQAFKALAYGV